MLHPEMHERWLAEEVAQCLDAGANAGPPRPIPVRHGSTRSCAKWWPRRSRRWRDTDDRLRLLTVTAVDITPGPVAGHGVPQLASVTGARGPRRAEDLDPEDHQPPGADEAHAAPRIRVGSRRGPRASCRGDPSQSSRAPGDDAPAGRRCRDRVAGTVPRRHVGMVVVDKEAGWTSHDAVARCRRIFSQRRVRACRDPRSRRHRSAARGPGSVHADAALPHRPAQVLPGRGGARTRPRAPSTRRARSPGRGTCPVSPSATCARRRARSRASWIRSRRWSRRAKVGGRRLHELARAGIEVERAARPVTVTRFDVERVSRRRTRGVPHRGGLLDRHLRPGARR